MMSDFKRICEECRIRWIRCVHQRIELPIIPLQRQKEQEQQIQKLLPMLDNILEESDEEKLRSMILSQLKKEGLWQFSSLEEQDQEQFYEISRQFILDARAFDEELSSSDIGQAMRNVWIFLILEQLFQRPLKYHPGIFAYSMLYPYTDNFLDDTNISYDKKKSFNDWFTRRLAGETLLCEEVEYEAIHELVSLIEGYYDRNEYPAVYEALLLIQRAQVHSLLQDQKLDEEKLLSISIEKGGASVVADGMLINGEMSEQEFAFCVEFGFLLQIADDIQDMIEDQEVHHYTLPSIAKNKLEREELVHQLLSFTEAVVTPSICPKEELLSFIKENCKQLILFSVMKSKNKYTGHFITQMKKRMPVRLSFLKAMSEEMEGRNILAQLMDSVILQS